MVYPGGKLTIKAFFIEIFDIRPKKWYHEIKLGVVLNGFIKNDGRFPELSYVSLNNCDIAKKDSPKIELHVSPTEIITIRRNINGKAKH